MLLFITLSGTVDAQVKMPDLGDERQQVATTLEVLVLVTVLSLVPAFLMMTTCFTRIIVVLAFMRQALALQQLPPNQVLIGLALFMSAAIMAPTWHQAYNDGIEPYLEKGIDPETGEPISLRAAYLRAIVPIRGFMFDHTREEDLRLFLDISGKDTDTENQEDMTREDVPTFALVSAFMISELQKAFWMGFLLYLPFLVIDMVVASVLMSMGMMMLPPVMISLPFKVLLFVMVDGWNLVVGHMLRSYI